MDIREYNIKKLPYHFVLFYDLPEDKLFQFKAMYDGQAGDNALLTYCYLDEMVGVSYRAICWVTIDGEGALRYHHEREMKTMLILREDSLNCNAVVYEESDMTSAKHRDNNDTSLFIWR